MQDNSHDLNGPLVSICCLVYNHEPYLRDCFEGFVKQKTSFPIEILVHDDASTDRSADIIREYTAKYPDLFKPIYQTENQGSKGVRISLKYQFPRAQGKYIALCEGDDYWTDPDKLQMQVDWLEKHPEYAMHFHRSELLYEADYPCGLKCDSIEDRDYSATELFENWIAPTASICLKKESFSSPIKHAENILNGDIFFIEKAAHIGKVRGCAKKMSVYRIHATGVTYDKKKQKKRIFAYPKHFSAIKENFPLIEVHVINKKLFDSCIQAWTCSGYQIKWLKKAFFSSPNLFIKTFLFEGFQDAHHLMLQKKHKEALFSLPILRLIIPIIYYNILKKQ